jgi:hypothetical protein
MITDRIIAVFLLCAMGVLGRFGDREELNNQLYDFVSKPTASSSDEDCCNEKKDARRWVLFARFMNSMPERRLIPRPKKPHAFDSSYDLYCSLENVTRFHYIDIDYRDVPNKKWLSENPFGTEETNNWAGGFMENNLKMLWGPLVPKTGTTSITKCFRNREILRSAKLENIEFDKFEGNPEEYTVLTAVRDPLDRFFSSHSQIEAFAHMGWYSGGSWRKDWNITFLNKHCPISYWAYRTMGYQARKEKGDFRRIELAGGFDFRLDRVEAYLEDIETKGYFNWHNHPMTKFLAESAKLGLLKHTNGFVDTKQVITGLKKHWHRSYNITLPCANRKSMSAGENTWAVKGRQMRSAATKSARARALLRRICMVYALDFRCMSFTIPLACKDMQLDVRKPNIPIPTDVDMSPEDSACCKRLAEARQRRRDPMFVEKNAPAKRAAADFALNTQGKQCFLKAMPYYKEKNVPVFIYPTTKHDISAKCVKNASHAPLVFAESEDGKQMYVPPLSAASNFPPTERFEVVVQDPIRRILLAYNRIEVRFCS